MISKSQKASTHLQSVIFSFRGPQTVWSCCRMMMITPLTFYQMDREGSDASDTCWQNTAWVRCVSTALCNRKQRRPIEGVRVQWRKLIKKKTEQKSNVINLRVGIKDLCMLWRTQGQDGEMCEWIFDVLAPRSQVMLSADPPRLLGKGSPGSKGTWNTAEWGISGLRRSLGILPR